MPENKYSRQYIQDNLRFERLESSSHPDFEKYFEIYDSSFPPNEKLWRDIIEKCLDNGSYYIYLGKIDDEVLCFASFWDFEGTRYTLFDYTATKAEYRGLGVARKLFSFIPEIERFADKDFLMEVENPDKGNNVEERRARVGFYKSMGIKTFNGVRYICPPLQAPEPTDMILMIIPREDRKSAPGKEVADIVIMLYTKLYRRKPTDPLLIKILNSIPQEVEII